MVFFLHTENVSMSNIKALIFIISALIISLSSVILMRYFVKTEYRKLNVLLQTGLKIKFLFNISISWLFLWLFLSWVFTQKIIYGFLSILILPLILKLIIKIHYSHFENELEKNAISILHALYGLLSSGLGLPVALFKLIEKINSPFTQVLKQFLIKYEEGLSLSECLLRFSRRTSTLQIGICLNIFEIAYRKGLPLIPFLDYIIPVLEDEIELKGKISSQRKVVIVQLIFALLIPWILLLYMSIFGTEFSLKFSFNHLILIINAILWELLGVFIIWRVSAFY